MGEERDLGIRIKMIPPVIDLIPVFGPNHPTNGLLMFIGIVYPG
jgi:hypothetical protein